MKRDCRNHKNTEDDIVNSMPEEIKDALVLGAHGLIDVWVLDLGVSFHSTSH